MRTYTTKQGDMWDGIAHAQLGDAAHTDRLMKENNALLHFYIFPAGVVVKLPEVSNARINDKLPPWKKVVG